MSELQANRFEARVSVISMDDEDRDVLGSFEETMSAPAIGPSTATSSRSSQCIYGVAWRD